MPAGDGLTFAYGDYSFDPRPLFTVNKEIIKTASNTGLATKYSMTLNGTILPTGIDLNDSKGGITTVLSGINDLRTAFNTDFNLLLLQCDDEPALVSGFPKVMNVDINHASDNYVRRADYSINLELPSLTGATFEPVGISGGIGDLSASGLLSISDDISIDFLDERLGGEELKVFNSEMAGKSDILPTVFSIQRSISAEGDSLPATGTDIYIEPWERAKAYVENQIKDTGNYAAYFSGIMCIDGLNITNNFRTVTVDKIGGSCSATEASVAFLGDYLAIEDFEVNVENSIDSPFTSVSLNGTIQGFENIDYFPNDTCPASGSKFNNAIDMWENSIKHKIYSRATGAALHQTNPAAFTTTDTPGHPSASSDGVLSNFLNIRDFPTSNDFPLHVTPMTTAIGYNTIAGTMTYSYTYNDRLDLIEPAALVETMNWSFNDGPDLYASLTVIGRPSGPLLQELGTKGPTTREISIDAIFKPTSGYNDPAPPETSNYEEIMKNYDDSNMVITTDNKTYEPRIGHFTWTRAWESGTCADPVAETS